MKYWQEFRQLIFIDDHFLLTVGNNLSKKNFNTIAVKNLQEVLSCVTDASSLLNIQQMLTTNDSNYSNLFTAIDSPYLLDTIRVP